MSSFTSSITQLSVLILAVGCAPQTSQTPPIAVEPEQQLVLRGAPAIPDDLTVAMADYLEARPISLQAISDDGRAILMTTRLQETSQLFYLDDSLSEPKQLTFEQEPVRSARFIPGANAYATFMADIGGNEQYQVLRLELATGKTSLLTDGKSRHGSYLWSPSGQFMLVTNNARNGRDMDLYLSDGTSTELTPLLETQGYWYPLDISHDEKQVILGQYISAQSSRVYLFDLDSKALTALTPRDKPGANRQARFSPDGRSVFLSSDRDREHLSLFEIDLASQRWSLLSEEIPWSVEQISISTSTSSVAFSVNADGYSQLYLLNLKDRSISPVKTPKGILGSLKMARSNALAAFTFRGAADIGSIFSLSLSSGERKEIARGDLGELKTSELVEPTLARYQSFDGMEIPSFYYKPRGEGPFPTIIKIHGGPESQSRPTFNTLVQYLVSEAGYAVLTPNVRGSRGYGKAYLALDNGMRRKDSVRDIGALLDWIRHQPELDSTRVGVIGGSYGGYMVLASLLDYGKRIRAGVDVVGISNFVTFLENTKPYRRDLRRQEYGDERDPKMRAYLEQISPTRHIDKLESALMVAHGANDPRVPLSETDQIVEAAEALGKPVWYMVAHNEGHGFRKRKNRDTYLMLAVLFFEEHLSKP